MSGDDIPYQLRQNKFIDRELFVDVASRIVGPKGADKYAYISMGGKHLRDHVAIYKGVGIRNLLSFDSSSDITDRQTFNRPVDTAVCETFYSGNVPARLDSIATTFPGVGNVIVWLDYTDPSSRLAQFQEAIEVAKRALPGDVLRVTMNANNQTLDGDSKQAIWKKEKFRSPAAYRRKKLKDQLGDLFPNSVRSIDEHQLPQVLAKSFGLAMSRAEAANKGVKFKPVLNTTYKDGQRMVTMTCVALRPGGGLRGLPQVGNWPFCSKKWTDVVEIEAPDLSLREKFAIDQALSSDAGTILDNLGFYVAKSREKSVAALDSYKRMHRHYPSFQHTEN